jgi:hypothetical protein
VFVVVELADASVEEVATRAGYAEGATLRTLLSWETTSGAAIARCRSTPLQKAGGTEGRGSDVELELRPTCRGATTHLGVDDDR